MFPRHDVMNHPAAASLLQYAQNGCPVDCGPHWSADDMAAAIAKGAHQSAKDPVAASACRKEALERAADGCCRIVSWNDIKHNPPANLKISPIAAIPHKSRLFRMILDLSFVLRVNGKPLTSVNDASDKSLAPQHAMYELGNVIPRLIWAMALAPDTGIPFMFTKVDLKDGYWRMVVNANDAWNFAYVLPPANPGDDVELVIPDSLQMGWGESPPFFCAATETARDIADKNIADDVPLPEHPMENIMMDIDWDNIPTHSSDPTQSKFLTLLEVYVDDFLGMVQSTDPIYLRKVTRSLLHAIEHVFPGPDITGSSMGPAVSRKKLIADGTWATRKEILGWLIDGIARTIELPPDKATKLLNTLRVLRRAQATITTSELRKLHGKLQFASIALPCGKALLGPIDAILAQADIANHKRIKMNSTLKHLLTDWAALIRLMATRPTHVKELVEHKPSYQGLVDASKWGVGGVWFGGTNPLEPFVWYIPWPDDIRNELCSASNPAGNITISDLELMGIFMHFLAFESRMAHLGGSIKHQSLAIWCDNLPAVSWMYKFRTSTSSIASRILRAFAVRLHVNATALLAVDHISGVYNVMADVASRKHSTNPATFLTNFTTLFPPPQAGYWTLFQFTDKRISRICSELRHKPSQLESWRRLSAKGGVFGRLGPNGSLTISRPSIPNSTTSINQIESHCWLPSPSMCDPVAFQPDHVKFAPKQSKWRYAPSPRSSYWTENKARWDRRKAATQRRYNSFSRGTDGKTRPHNRNSPSLSQSRATSHNRAPAPPPPAPKQSAISP